MNKNLNEKVFVKKGLGYEIVRKGVAIKERLKYIELKKCPEVKWLDILIDSYGVHGAIMIIEENIKNHTIHADSLYKITALLIDKKIFKI